MQEGNPVPAPLRQSSGLVGGQRTKVLRYDAIAREVPRFHHIAPLANRRNVLAEAQLPEPSP
jgi:hypothetical protein